MRFWFGVTLWAVGCCALLFGMYVVHPGLFVMGCAVGVMYIGDRYARG